MIDTLDIKTCFFCNKLIIDTDKLYTKEDYVNIQNLFGIIPDRAGGKIGNKAICKSCKNDIWALVQNEEY